MQKVTRDRQYQKSLASIVLSDNPKNLKKCVDTFRRYNSWVGKGEPSPLHIAARYNRVKVCYALLKEGITPDVTEPLTQKTPMHIAAYFGNLEIAKLLKDFNADLSLKDAVKCSPLHYAAMGCQKEFMLFLLENQVSPLLQSLFGNVLDILIRKRNYELVDVFSTISGAAAINLDDYPIDAPLKRTRDAGWTPLHSAAASGQVDILKLLCSKFPHIQILTQTRPTLHKYSEPVSVMDLALLEGSDSTKKFLRSKRSVRDYRQQFIKRNWYETGFPDRKILCDAIRHRDVNAINKILNEKGLRIIFERQDQTRVEKLFQDLTKPNTLDFAALVYSLPFFDLLIDKKVKIPISEFCIHERERNFFLHWALMELHPLAEAFLRDFGKEGANEIE